MEELKEKIDFLIGYLTAMIFVNPDLGEKLESVLNLLSESSELIDEMTNK